MDGQRTTGPGGQPAFRQWHQNGKLRFEKHYVDGVQSTREDAAWDWKRAAAVCSRTTRIWRAVTRFV